ncbi:MAG TPA: hypothetical protein DCS07_12515 [Bdellovibrionales bacterium]|nr:MAG: hypothetical protein A2Z97_16265 [Bdellovibrionales bacterium GWB1_52_6]OFZ04546.1 MAG: hypothetical protein A2X97_13055 [Bdellovibrionales bacterium GWA1_52_35]HAR43433.1 hypothetical protein [Bdellovibrionales bacterium]HCM39954.1 hypothetical protein [Bdellovibrionales bacterium]
MAFAATLSSMPASADYDSPELGSIGAPEFFIPRGCEIEDWCLVKATSCTLVYDSGSLGNYQSTAKYSIIRRAAVLCPAWNGTERRIITGPIEEMPFRSRIFAHLHEARTEVFELCNRYRDDFVSIAPSCSTWK